MLAYYELEAKSTLLSGSVNNKVVLGHKHTHLYRCYLWMLSQEHRRVEHLQWSHVALKAQHI